MSTIDTTSSTIGDTFSTGTTSNTPRGTAVSLRGVNRAFGSVQALRDFDLDLAPGEFVALLGPSGCGKTTALRALAGLEDIDFGEIHVGGREVSGVPANKRGMAMVFQAYSLFPNMTVLGNIDFALKLAGFAKGERTDRAKHFLNLVHLPTQAGRYPHQLSGGQQQRVALARALAVNPTVLLLDEPLSALDAKVRVSLREEIRRLQQETGITTLFVTHDQEEALAVADRVGVMKDGQLQQIDTPVTIYNEPVSEFVADFIGTANRVHTTATGGVANVLGRDVRLLPGSAEGDVTVMVRPERLRLVPDEHGTGRVITTSFLGSTLRTHVEHDGADLITQAQPDTVRTLTEGQRVRVELDPQPVLAVAR